MRRRKPQPWYSDIGTRVRFERGARAAHPSLRARTTGRGFEDEVVYTLTIDVPEYEQRQVTISLVNGMEPYGARISVDGPTDSPHRYGEDRLCIWDPRDPEALQWTGADGLAELIAHIRRHLFKEAWWRETGEWLGPEAPHGPLDQAEAA